MTREPGRAPPRHAHGDLTSLAPHERLPEILVQARVLEWGAIASPITSWQIDGETMETVTDYFGAPKSLWMVIVAMKLRYKNLSSLDTITKICSLNPPLLALWDS